MSVFLYNYIYHQTKEGYLTIFLLILFKAIPFINKTIYYDGHKRHTNS